jgi:hypothetical protein
MTHRDTVREPQTRWLDVIEADEENDALRMWRTVDQGSQSYMFSDDIDLGIMPYSIAPGMAIDIHPADDEVVALVTKALAKDSWGDVEDAVTKFIRQCASGILAYGKSQYEVVIERSLQSKPVAFDLQWVTPHTIQRRFGRWVQDIGRRRAEQRGWPRFTRIDIERIVTFELPSPLTTRKLLVLKRTLAGVGTDMVPEGYLRGEGFPPGYDFNEFQRLRTRAEATATSIVGWNGRGGLRDRLTDYYYLVREIRFQRFIVALRDAILDRLNLALSEVLPQFGQTGRIVLENFTTVDDIDRLSADLEHGLDLREGFQRVARF